MPTYLQVCLNPECALEFEDFYSVTAPIPPCPKCASEAKRLISGGSGRGIVELTGHELTAKLKEDVRQLKKDASKSEKLYANLLGESKMETLQRSFDKRRKR